TQVQVIEADSPRPLNEVSSSKRVRLRAGAHFDHAACPYSVTQAGHAFHGAEERAFLFEAVTEDMNAAIVAGWSQRMDRALEAVEGVGGAVHAHLKRLVVIVSAGFAFGHDGLPFAWECSGYNPRQPAPVPSGSWPVRFRGIASNSLGNPPFTREEA